MPIDVWSDEVEIGRPVDEVTGYAFDPANDASWIGGIHVARLEGDGPIAVGSRVRRTARFLGQRIPYLMEIRQLRPGELRMHAIESPFPMDVTYRFDPAGAGRTRGRIRVAGEPGGYYRLAGRLLPGMVRRSVTGDLRRLKRILEGASAH